MARYRRLERLDAILSGEQQMEDPGEILRMRTNN